MDYSITLAQILGPFYFIVMVVFLFNQQRVDMYMKEFQKSTFAMVMGGLLALAVGMFFVVTHNVWVLDWPVLITLLGWMALVKGVVMLGMPKEMGKLIDVVRKNKMAMKVAMMGWLFFALYLSFVGYFG